MLKIKTRKRPKTKISSSGNKADPLLFAVVMFLLIFGLVMITSIGVPKSIQLSAPNILYPNCSDASVDCYLLFKNHLIRLLVGLGMLFVASKIGYRFWKKTSSVIFRRNSMFWCYFWYSFWVPNTPLSPEAGWCFSTHPFSLLSLPNWLWYFISRPGWTAKRIRLIIFKMAFCLFA